MYDKCHQGNTKQLKEILRRTEFVKELDGLVTETAEQLNSFLSKSLYFLDVLSPIHQIQMIRSMFAEKNRLKNEEIIKKVQGLSGYGKFTHDAYGRVAVDIES